MILTYVNKILDILSSILLDKAMQPCTEAMQPYKVNGTELLISKPRRLLRLFKTAIKFPKHLTNGVFIHPDSSISKHADIGVGTRINGAAYIDCSREAAFKIGKFSAIARNFCVRTADHHTGYINLQARFQREKGFQVQLVSKGPVTIGNNVWIGDNVTVLSGVSIGDGTVIGSGAVVTKNIPAYSIAVGVPARVVKKRFSDNIISQLVDIKWWDWPMEKIKRNKVFFETDFSAMEKTILDEIIV